jgi:O-antigen/teichoic acid export membrane protein
MIQLFQRIQKSAAAWSFLATLLRVGANVFVLPLVLRQLPPDELGVWYVFGTLGGLASLLDLGFEQTITRMTSYVWGGATRLVAFGLHQEEATGGEARPNLPLLRDLVATLKAYYFYLGLAVLAVLAAGGGGYVWWKTQGLASAGTLRLAWFVYAGGCCLNFMIGRWPALLTGIGAVRAAQVAGVVSQLAYYAVAVGGLLAGLGVWALVAAFVVMGFVARHQGRKFFNTLAALPGGLPGARFHRELFRVIWPNAWRTGLVSIGSFLTVQANTLVCSAYLSLATTAVYGLSFQLVNILFGLCGVWLAVKLPAINTLRQQGRTAEIEELFARRLRLTLLSYLAGALMILLVAPAALHWIGSKTTLITPAQLAVLLLIRFLELHQTQYCYLILSENNNPFLKPSLFGGAAIVLVSLVLTPVMGVWGLLLSMGGVQLAFNDWWPVWRGLRGLQSRPGEFFRRHYFRLRAWRELF